jgi:type VI secretion system protein ImpL
VPIAEHALAQLIDSIDDYHLDLAKLIGHPLGIQAQGRVRGAFTRRGWENRVNAQLSASALVHGGEPWVLGMDDGADRRRQERTRVDELRSMYFQAYVKEWKTFVSTLRIQRPHGSAATLALLTELSSGEPTPIAKLLQQIDDNVRLERGKPNKVEQAVAELSGSQAGRFGPRELAAAFDGLTQFAVAPEQGEKAGPKPTLGHDTYREQVWYVRDALQSQSDNPLDPSSSQARIQSASVRVRALIDSQEIGWRPTFDALLWPPIEAGAQGFIERNGHETDSRWQNEIVQPFERALRGRYPFRSEGADVSLDDFDRFYRPGDGALAKYTAEALRDTVRLEGDSFIWGRELGKSAGSIYGRELLDFLARSRSLSAAFYPQGSRTPRVDFEARIKAAPTVASTVLDVGGDRIEYHNGPERWQPLSWPGSKLSNGASLQIRGANIKESVGHGGVWGLFRLIETGVVTPGSSGDMFSVSWQLARDVTVTVEFRPSRRESPFFAAGRGSRPLLFQPLRSPALQPPRQILRASR